MTPMNKPKVTTIVAAGWLIKTDQGYYTGKPRHALERWTPFPKLAKVYHRQRWAQSMATRFGGQAVPYPMPDASTTKLT